MSAVNDARMLSAEQLNDIDEWILDFLQQHEWATPNLIRLAHGDSTGDIKSRQWISDRIRRLEEHGHLETVQEGASERRLVNDPRDTDDRDGSDVVEDGGQNGTVSETSGEWHENPDELLDEEAPGS